MTKTVDDLFEQEISKLSSNMQETIRGSMSRGESLSYKLFVTGYTLGLASLQSLLTDATDHQLSNWHSTILKGESVEMALHRLLSHEVEVALDPKVSKAARDLIELGRNQDVTQRRNLR